MKIRAYGKLETYYTKEKLREMGYSSKTFYYTVSDSLKRDYNKRIDVFCLNRKGEPSYIGVQHVNTASYKGDRASACDIIRAIFGYKSVDGYGIDREDVKVFFV